MLLNYTLHDAWDIIHTLCNNFAIMCKWKESRNFCTLTVEVLPTFGCVLIRLKNILLSWKHNKPCIVTISKIREIRRDCKSHYCQKIIIGCLNFFTQNQKELFIYRYIISAFYTILSFVYLDIHGSNFHISILMSS